MLTIEVYNNESPIKNTSAIINLIQKQMESIGSPKTPQQINQTVLNIFKPASRAVLFVGYDSKNIPVVFAFGNVGVGFEAGGDYFWLNELYVDISCRRYGYASALLSFAEKWLKDKGINYIACITGNDNIAAQNMYQKKGFDLSTIIWVDKSL
jgi:ribosomal protein S18 acetylase RimI-like enzyme